MRVLCRRVAKYFKYAPGVSCLLGPLDAEVKVRKQTQRIQRKPVGQVVAPKVLQAEDMEAQVNCHSSSLETNRVTKMRSTLKLPTSRIPQAV